MKRLIFALLLLFVGLLVSPSIHAQAAGSASDLHFNGFVIYNEAGRLEKSGDLDMALAKYKQAGELYSTLEKNYPTYEVETRTNRQRTIATAIARGTELKALRTTRDQLQTALNQERDISIATGMVMVRLDLDRAGAFEFLRRQARSSRRKLGEVAHELIGNRGATLKT